MKHINVSILFLSFIIFTASISFAQAQSADDYFNQGIKASEQNNHKEALNYFTKARIAGMKRPSLDYNQAVSYYRLGQYEPARKLFSGLTQDKEFSQLAFFNLGLIANKKNDEKSAISWFQKAYANDNDESVSMLAETALNRLGAKPDSRRPSKSRWSGFASASLVSDSNVNLATDEVNQPSVSDTSYELYAAGNGWLSGNRKNGARIELSGVMQNYNSETQYDFMLLHIGISRFIQLGEWDTKFNGSMDEINVNGSSYERVFSAMADTKKDLTNDSELQLRYRFSSIDATNQVYNYLSGTRQQFRAGLQKRYGIKKVRAYYEYEINNREDFGSYVTNDFSSYSPTRHTINLTGEYPITNDWKARLDGRYRTSDYDQANNITGGGTVKRSDSQYLVAARLAYEIARNLGTELKLSFTNNDSNINAYNYDRTIIQAGINWLF